MKVINPEEIRELIFELFDKKFTREYTSEDINRVFSQNNVFPFVYYINGKMVAMTMLYVVELFSRKLGVIEEVVTLSEFRNRGIGSGLVKKAIEKAREFGCDCVELTVREDRPQVQGFYQGLGFYDRNNKAYRLSLKNQ